MDKMLLLGGEIAGVTAALLVGYVTLLFYRAPNHARWLESDAATTTVLIALMAALIFSLGALVAGVSDLVEDPLASIVIALVLFSAIGWVLWKLLRMTARLQAADAGASPFHVGHAGVPSPRRKPRRGRTTGAA